MVCIFIYSFGIYYHLFVLVQIEMVINFLIQPMFLWKNMIVPDINAC